MPAGEGGGGQLHDEHFGIGLGIGEPLRISKLAIAMKQIQVIVIAFLHLEYKQISSINPCRQYPVL